MRPTVRTLGLLAALALVLAACASDPDSGETTTTAGTGETTTSAGTLPKGTTSEPETLQVQALEEFDRCDAFLDYVVSHAVDLVGPYGLEGGHGTAAGAAEEMAEATAADGGDDAAAQRFSETNVQVDGVDEPDMVKTDGERIVLISEGTLIVVDVSGDEPVEVGRLAIDDFGVQNLFLSGDRVLVFGSVWNNHPIPLNDTTDRAVAPVSSTPTVRIMEVDISGEPQTVRTVTVDGRFISGRMVGDSVRLVLTSPPVGLEWSHPEGSGLRAEREATEENREIVRDSTADNWIPYYIVTDADGEVTDEGRLFDCDRAAHPDEFSGLDMLSVVTIDVGAGLEVTDSTGVLATGDTVYASGDTLYVATQSWDSWVWFNSREESDRPDGPSTEVHKFDIGDPATTDYVASGSVDGYLLNQFAMDEHEGRLRVASTTTPSWWGSGPDSESRITILEEDGTRLEQVGMVDGLGETERIYSVRFMGDVGYVVTFRQVDPLYTVDLSDPSDPRVLGELKITGYSAYLHPVGQNLIMGVGQDATEEGRVQGTQVSVFDVSNLTDPTRVDTYTLGEGTNSEVEHDHHAFLYWEDLALMPIQQWRFDDRGEEVKMGLVGLRVADDGSLSEVGEVVHPGGEGKTWDGRSQIRRSVVIDGSVYTISRNGIMKSTLDGLDEEAWLEF